MKILVVHGQKIEHYPPVRNLVDVLTRNGFLVTLITKYDSEPRVEYQHNLKLIKINDNENSKSLKNVFDYMKKKKQMKKLVVAEMKKHDILWTTTDSTVRDLGKVVLKYKHIMQLMELIEDMPAFPGVNSTKLNIKRYARKSYKVVVPEYNRAHIQKVWWQLDVLPSVLPNKMSSLCIDEPTAEIKSVIEKINFENRKILLYQGSFKGDRNLEIFAEAVNKKKDEYVMYIMGADSDERKALCNRFPAVVYIPFITPPYHLLVSKCAYIGLLPYVPEKVGFNSELNALYCAPNKIFEFSGFGVPMIGNDVPGLTLPFERYNIGKTRKGNSVDEIIKMIDDISSHYEEMSKNCIAYFNSYDLDSIVKDILKEN